MHTSALEARTRTIGEEIFLRAESAAPSVFSMEFWQQKAMTWMTADEELKHCLFRFVEALPALKSTESIARHLTDFLGPRLSEVADANALVTALKLALSYRRPDSFFATTVASLARFACTRSAERFVCGSTAEEAIASVQRLRRQGMTFTLDLLGETVIADHVAQSHQERYIDLIRELTKVSNHWDHRPQIDVAAWGPVSRVNISIKLSAIVARLDAIDPIGAAAAVSERLRPILRTARECGAFINVDMEHYAVKDLTLEIYKSILMEPEFRDWPDCGIVIQAYTPEAEWDMLGLIAWTRHRVTPIHVRLVKGAYWDSETATAVRNGWPIPLYTEKWQSDAAFERMAQLMLENVDIIRPAFASHNVRSLAAVLALAELLNLPPHTVELQMLTGMGDPLKRALVAMKQRVRVYSPFGDLMTGMAYLIRRLIENTANESFLRQSFDEHVPRELLLRNPADPSVRVPARLPEPFIQDPDEYCEMHPFVNESDVDFSRPENRDAMQAALALVRHQFGKTYPACIGNQPVTPPRWYESKNPSAPREVVGRVAVCDRAIADKAVLSARAASEAWAATSPEERAAMLDRSGEILRTRRFEIAAWMIYELGKTWREAHGDLLEAIDYLHFYAYEMRRLTTHSRRRDYPGERNEYAYLSRGVALVIGPFCFPVSLLTGMTAAALVTGNTVIVKPATPGSVCAAKMVEIFLEAGLPAGVLSFVPGFGEEVGDHLVHHSGVDVIAFTGSSQVGSQIIEAAATSRTRTHVFKNVVADLGGKNAIIVDDDADLDNAIQAVMASAFGYGGQKCTACSRVVVLKSIYKEFLEKLVEASRGIKPAAAELPGTSVGPLINAEALVVAQEFISLGKKEAHCVLDAKLPDSKTSGYFLGPVIFAEVNPQSRLAQEEIMAPILCVIRAEDFDQAINIANGTPYGLTGGVYSRSPSHIESAKRRLNCGVLYINRKITLSRVDRQPFGGFKQSGFGGKTGGPDYLQQFMLPRTISEYTARQGLTTSNDSRHAHVDKVNTSTSP